MPKIVAYTYDAETLCGECVVKALTFDDKLLHYSTEDALDALAKVMNIDRQDEYSFDSSEFPKVVFDTQIEEIELCDHCAIELGEY